MNNFRLASQYIRWYIGAKNLHGIHSPFLYRFLEQCLYQKHDRQLFAEIEKERTRLKHSYRKLTFMDPGAGSRGDNPLHKALPKTRSIARIANRSLQPARYAGMLYRIAVYFNYKKILEMGTNLGITAAYLSKAHAQVHTIEGAHAIAEVAEEVFNNLNCKNIQLHKGNFDCLLPHLLNRHEQFDMVFLDGDHNGEKVLKYFNLLIKHISKEGVLVLDDIRWSSSMQQAWRAIKNHPDVNVTVDLFFMGLVFFNPALSKEHFNIRF